MSGKIFETVNAKRAFVALYEEMPEERKATFGQNIRDMFDQKITDVTRIEGFYLTEADVQLCYDAAMKTPKALVDADRVNEVVQDKTTRFKEEDDDFNRPATEESNLPKNW